MMEIAGIYNDFLVQPLFNLLVFLYSIIPGHDFGVALIIFTIMSRLAIYPLLKKQLYQSKLIKSLQPEIKKIKESTKGVPLEERRLTMELYKEKGISTFGTIGILIIQIPLFLALYAALSIIIKDPSSVGNSTYGFLSDLGAVKAVRDNVESFNNTFLGIVDLSRMPIGDQGFYFPAFLLAAGSAMIQFFQIRQTMSDQGDAKSLSSILKQAKNSDNVPDSSDVQAATMRTFSYIMPVFIFFITLKLVSALGFYWFVGGVIGYIQQRRILKMDMMQFEQLSAKSSKVKVTVTKKVNKPEDGGAKAKKKGE